MIGKEKKKTKNCEFCQADLGKGTRVCWQCGKLVSKKGAYCTYCEDKEIVGDYPACEKHLSLYIISQKLEKISGVLSGIRKDNRKDHIKLLEKFKDRFDKLLLVAQKFYNRDSEEELDLF